MESSGLKVRYDPGGDGNEYIDLFVKDEKDALFMMVEQRHIHLMASLKLLTIAVIDQEQIRTK